MTGLEMCTGHKETIATLAAIIDTQCYSCQLLCAIEVAIKTTQIFKLNLPGKAVTKRNKLEIISTSM